jgi:hypothetical protein
MKDYHIVWKREESPEWSTSPFWLRAQNHDGEELGYLSVESVGAHRHWVWRQARDIGMSPGCLQEVTTKMKELFGNRKKNEDELRAKLKRRKP